MESQRGQARRPESTTGSRQPTGSPKSVDRGHQAKVVLGVVLLVVIVALAVDNRRSTRIGYVFGHANAPMFVVVLLAAVIGAVIGWLLLHLRHARTHRQTGAHDGRNHGRRQGSREGGGR